VRPSFRVDVRAIHEYVYSPALNSPIRDYLLPLKLGEDLISAIENRDVKTLNALVGPSFHATSYDEWLVLLGCVVYHVNNEGAAKWYMLAQMLTSRELLLKERKYV